MAIKLRKASVISEVFSVLGVTLLVFPFRIPILLFSYQEYYLQKGLKLMPYKSIFFWQISSSLKMKSSFFDSNMLLNC